ncbi:hypothetical protein GOP47_0008837 [Adiantum capillus-veneris]|nr:hypothetical protein GOP47_0008837 [Adiantum capillus-veneris]
MSNCNKKRHVSFHSFSSSTNALDNNQGASVPQPAFNRAPERRADSIWLSEVFSTSALIIPFLGSKSLVKSGEPVLLPSKNLPKGERLKSACIKQPIFLGLRETSNEPLFAVEVSSVCREHLSSELWPEGCEWVDLRSYASELKSNDAGLLAYARGLVEWHMRNRFCSCCGGEMEFKEGGHSLQCSSRECGSSIYPRLDPAVIVLVTCGEYLLLGRQSRWKPGRYSLLAGFVEVGETFETAAAREIQEESGIKVKLDGLRYIASQPWPFPQSLMVGFMAEAEEKQLSFPKFVDDVVPVGNEGLRVLMENTKLPTIAVDTKELEDARWIHRSYLKAVLQNQPLNGNRPFSVPGSHAVANFLMQWWISYQKNTEWGGDEVSSVEIDEGVFKYILIRVSDGKGNQKLVVRGNKRMSYHADIFNHTTDKLRALKLQVEVLGGGRIDHHVTERVILVYGFSQAYGQANHAVTVALLKQWFPFHTISFDWDGY